MYEISNNFKMGLDGLRESGKLKKGEPVYVCFKGSQKPLREIYDGHTDESLNLTNYRENINWSEISYLQIKRDEALQHSTATDDGMPDHRE